MAKLAQGDEIQKGNTGGGGFGAPDVSDKLEDMSNYEKAILNPSIFQMLAELKVPEFDEDGKMKDAKKYEFLVLEASDIENLKAKSMGAAGHGTNSEFAALEIPFRSIPFASKDVEAIEKAYTAKAGADKAGKIHKVTETDCLKIYRTGAEFDPALYAVDSDIMDDDEIDTYGDLYEKFGLRTSKKGKNKGKVLTHETFTIGQKLRADRWLAEVAVEKIDEKVLEKIGITVE